MMADELPILKGILNGVVDYHNARKSPPGSRSPSRRLPSDCHRGYKAPMEITNYFGGCCKYWDSGVGMATFGIGYRHARDSFLPRGRWWNICQDTCANAPFSVAAVRFGRVPKREKARILAAMQQSSNSRSLEKAISAELEDEQRLMATVVRAHLDTCDFTRDKVEPMLQRAREQPSYTACPPTLVSITSGHEFLLHPTLLLSQFLFIYFTNLKTRIDFNNN